VEPTEEYYALQRKRNEIPGGGQLVHPKTSWDPDEK